MRKLMMITASTAAFFAAACTPAEETAETGETSAMTDMTTTDADTNVASFDNPLLAEWTGVYVSTLDFANASLDVLRGALRGGLALNLAAFDAIVSTPEPATFENIIL